MRLWRRQAPLPAADPPPSAAAAAPGGFDFTRHMRQLCADIVTRLEPLRHIDMARVAMSFSQTRKTGAYGMHASLTPLRFADGQMHTIRRGRKWTIQRVMAADGREMLYILNFYLPRFLDLPLREKLATTIHELWHVGPQFDGDLRRFGGRCFAHSGSQKRYEAQVARLLDAWLAFSPPQTVYDFLHLSFRELVERHGRVYGQKIPTPKLIPVEK